LLTGLLQCSHDGIVVTGADFHVLHVSPVFSELTGFPAEEAIGRHMDFIRPVALDVEASLDEICQTIRTQGHWAGRLLVTVRNGEKLPLSLKATAIAGENPEAGYCVFSFGNPSTESHAGKHQPALIDALTKLPNRVLLIDRLQQTIAQARRTSLLVAVILMDLDNFRSINNRYGYPFGDRLLRKIAHRLNQALRAGDTVARADLQADGKRPGDTVARVGGDEFVIIATGLPHMDALENIVNRILNLVALPCEIDGWEVTVTASLGVTVYPFDAVDPETLIRHADQAMYQAKEFGRNGYHLFDAERDQQAHTRRQLLERLKVALANDELLLHYQPKVNLRNGKVIGVEALLRWNHPERGLVMPGEFLPHIEHDELILDIGKWVTRRAMAQVTEWRAQGLDLSVSVNVAARQLLRDDFVDCVKCCLADFPDLPAGTLEFEILESSAIANTTHVHDVIKTCEELGIQFSLDDFGTGYASLTYLKEIPAEILKIDQSFIRHILDEGDDLTLVEGVIGLASAFRRVVVAEGVETAEQGVLLMRLGCDLAQGYGIARPMPPEQVPDWVTRFRPDPQWALWADTDWEMVDFPLLVAQYDHLKWIHRVAMSVEGTGPQLSNAELVDYRQCRFGNWYYGHGMARYGQLQEFRDLEDIHKEVHRLGPLIVRLRQEGKVDEARHRMHELLALKDRILEQLGRLQAVVARNN
jgi:diguanylate cyclase (GGDEF)-like protein/PAS domain S-box-containing protein